MENQLVVVWVNEMLSYISVSLMQSIRRKSRLDVSVSRVILAEVQRTRQHIGNRVRNSARHRSTGLVLTIAAKKLAVHLVSKFTDTGPKLFKVHQLNFFDRYCRAGKLENRVMRGSGLGLVMAKAIVEAMFDSIRFVDTPGHVRGSEFVWSIQAC